MRPEIIEEWAEYIISAFDPSVFESPHPVEIDRLVELYLDVDIDYEEKIVNDKKGGLFSFRDVELGNGISVGPNTMVIDKRFETWGEDVSCNILMALLLSYLCIVRRVDYEMPSGFISLEFDESGAIIQNQINQELRHELDVFASALLIPKESLRTLLQQTRETDPDIGYFEIIFLMMKVYNVTYNLAVFRYQFLRLMELGLPQYTSGLIFTELENGI